MIRTAWARLTLVITIFVVMLAAPAHAATKLKIQASANQAEVGEGIRIELSAMVDDDTTPNTPRLKVPPGFSVQGPSISQSQSISFVNGSFEHLRGITASFIVIGNQPGRFVIGPGTVQLGQKVQQSDTVQIEVVAAGTIPRTKRAPRATYDPLNPFDPLGLLRQMPNLQGFDDDLEPTLPSEPEVPEEYRVERAADPSAFLRATVTPSHAVVGQQVTLRVYAYGGNGIFAEGSTVEASHADFLLQNLQVNQQRVATYRIPLNDRLFYVAKVREMALFPLRAGALTVGSMTFGFRGSSYPETRPMKGMERDSPPLVVNVTEPPVAGRPPGYELGDVGRYTLSAQVDPRRVTAGDSISVVVRLEGRGNVPNHVKVPEQKGVTWLDPTVSESIAPRESVIGGWRLFRYVVRLDEPGSVDLGEVTLPYYDAEARRYDVARAKVGMVEVLPNPATANAPRPAASATAAAATAPRDPFDGLGGPRDKLGPVTPAATQLTDSRGFWAFLGGAPLGVALLAGLVWLAQKLRASRGARTESFTAVAKRAIAEAEGAASRGDAGAVAAGVEKAVYTTIEGKLGLKARAVLRDRLVPELARSGADEPLAKEVTAVLDACDSLRFASNGNGEGKQLVAQAAAVVSRLAKVNRSAPEERAR